MGKVFLRHFVLSCESKTTSPFLIEISAKFVSQVNFLDSSISSQWPMDHIFGLISWGCFLLLIRGESLRETTLRGCKGVVYFGIEEYFGIEDPLSRLSVCAHACTCVMVTLSQ